MYVNIYIIIIYIILIFNIYNFLYQRFAHDWVTAIFYPVPLHSSNPQVLWLSLLSSLRTDFFPLSLQSTMAIWLSSDTIQSTGHVTVGLPFRCWPCSNYFPRKLLSSKMNQSILVNSGFGTNNTNVKICIHVFWSTYVCISVRYILKSRKAWL